jgi:transcriptional/translational regulatory protein YebC/TACO1
MKSVRLFVVALMLVGLSAIALPAFSQEMTPKQQAAQVAVQLGWLTYQAHAIKEAQTPADTQIENVMGEAMSEYAEKVNQMTLADLSNGKFPAFNPTHLKKVTKAFLANQKEFSDSEIDMSAAEELTAALLQQLILSAAMMQQ